MIKFVKALLKSLVSDVDSLYHLVFAVGYAIAALNARTGEGWYLASTASAIFLATALIYAYSKAKLEVQYGAES